MTDCPECEETRRKMAAMLRASQEWAANPLGGSIMSRYNKILAEGKTDGPVRPNS